MRALALLVLAVSVVLIVFGRFRRNNPIAIAGYAVLAVGLILSLLSR
jgi:predicted membrane-bound mannosyltransferase